MRQKNRSRNAQKLMKVHSHIHFHIGQSRRVLVTGGLIDYSHPSVLKRPIADRADIGVVNTYDIYEFRDAEEVGIR